MSTWNQRFQTACEMEKSVFVDQSVALYHQQSFSTQGGKGLSFCVYLRIFWDSFMCVWSVEVVLLSESAVNQCSWVLWKCCKASSWIKEGGMFLYCKWFSKNNTLKPGKTQFLSLSRQNLVVEGERYPIILNTHFSQKICVEIKQDNAGGPRDAVAVDKCRPPPLTRCLWRAGTSQVSTEKSIPCKQVRQLFPLMWSRGRKQKFPEKGPSRFQIQCESTGVLLEWRQLPFPVWHCVQMINEWCFNAWICA